MKAAFIKPIVFQEGYTPINIKGIGLILTQ